MKAKDDQNATDSSGKSGAPQACKTTNRHLQREPATKTNTAKGRRVVPALGFALLSLLDGQGLKGS